MSFFKSIGRGFQHFGQDLARGEKNLEKALQGFGKVISKPEVFIPVAVGVLGVAATVATGGLAAPFAAEAEAAALGIGAAEVAATEFVAVGGAELVGLSQPLLAEAVELGVVDLGSISSSLAPVLEESSMLSRFGLGGGRALRAAGQISKFATKAAPSIKKTIQVAGLIGTVVEVVKTQELEDEESKLSGKVSTLGNVVKAIGQTTEIITGISQKNIIDLGKTIGKIGGKVSSVESGINKLTNLQATTTQQLKDLKGLEITQEKELSAVERELHDLQQSQSHQQLNEEHFESKLVSRVLAEERELVGVVDDLAERLEESFIKDFDFTSMLDLMNRLEQDDIVGFLGRNQKDFNKLSKTEQNAILDLAIQKGL